VIWRVWGSIGAVFVHSVPRFFESELKCHVLFVFLCLVRLIDGINALLNGLGVW
jgi:hypothetical protein